MKKIMKRISSVVLTILIVLSSMTSVNVFASNSDLPLTVGAGETFDVNIGFTPVNTTTRTENIYYGKTLAAQTRDNTNTVNNDNAAVIVYDMPDVSEGKQIDKCVIRFALLGNASGNCYVNEVPNDVTLEGYTTVNVKNQATIKNEVDKVWEKTIGSYSVVMYTVDISDYAKKLFNAGATEIRVGLYGFNQKLWRRDNSVTNSNTSGFNGNDSRPHIYWSETEADEFTYTAATTPATSADALEFTFNNPVASSSVTPADFTVTDLSGEVEVDSEDIVVSGNKVSLELDWEDYGYYSIAFKGDVTDIYNQTISVNEQASFAIEPTGTTQSITSDPLIVMCNGTSNYCANTAHTSQTGRWVREDVIKSNTNHVNKVYFQKHYILFRFDLSSVPAGKNISNAMFSFRNNDAADYLTGVDVLAVDDYEWTVDSGVDTAYLNKLDSAKSCAKLLGNAVAQKDNKFYADVSAAVAAARTSGKNKITFAVYFAHTSLAFSTEEPGKAPALSLTLTDPNFNALSSDPAKFAVGVPVNKTINLELGTILSDGCAPEDCVELIDVKEDSAASAAITANGSKITIDPASDLAANTEYAVVLKEGTIDAFGNELRADKIVSRFTTGLAIEFDEIYFTSDASPVYGTSAKITGYNAGDSVTALAQVTNNTSADYSAIMIIALYSSDGALLEVDAVGDPAAAPAGNTTQFAKTISVDEDAEGTTIKAFVWRDLSTLRPISKLSSIEQN